MALPLGVALRRASATYGDKIARIAATRTDLKQSPAPGHLADCPKSTRIVGDMRAGWFDGRGGLAHREPASAETALAAWREGKAARPHLRA